MKMNYNPKLVSDEGMFKFIDSADEILKTRKVTRILERYRSYFSDFENLKLSPDLNYIELTDLIEKISSRIDIELFIDGEIQSFISQNYYAINEHKIAGLTIKDYDSRWNSELEVFKNTVDNEITRPLKEQQVQASFFLAMMKRAANFSVPGAGKTAMMYGAYAYLSSDQINEVDKIVVICPLNAFEAWRTEFIEVFGQKRELNFMNLKDYSNSGDIRTYWGVANVIVLNYESLSGWKLSVLNELINQKTMIVFDEVHRIKNPIGKRARSALELGKQSAYHYVLTGTPIPNSYQDIYNFLHLLYDNEYDTYFAWSIPDLINPNPAEINDKIRPFYWRTNKEDLKVPPADEDNIIAVKPSLNQEQLATLIHETETSVLARYIRLLQASTNPALLTQKIDINNIGFLFDEIDFNIDNALDTVEKAEAKQKMYIEMNVDSIRTPKYEAGIQLIRKLVSEGKKVIVWGMFVGTMQKIHQEIKESGILSHLIYGATPKEDRVGMINEFRDGNVQVLISNPATLGESISLHQTVHDAIYFEYNFNLTFMLQSRDRIHRLGLDPNQYTRYYYLMSEGSSATQSFIDQQVYNRLKEKEEVMQHAIDGQFLLPEITDDYLDDVKKMLLN